jgi:anti-anti-sigma factor
MSERLTPTATAFTWWRAYRGPGTERLFVAGELDIATAPELARALLSSRSYARVVELDLYDVEFIESSATRVMLDAVGQARDAGQRIVLLGGRSEVDRLLTLTGIADEMQWERSA